LLGIACVTMHGYSLSSGRGAAAGNVWLRVRASQMQGARFPYNGASDRGFSIILPLYTESDAAGPACTFWDPRTRSTRQPRHEFQTAPEGLREWSPTPACEIVLLRTKIRTETSFLQRLSRRIRLRAQIGCTRNAKCSNRCCWGHFATASCSALV
jgi:hypothetical protein